MMYLSKEIEALAKKNRVQGKSLIKQEKSCGIFQDYGTNEIYSLSTRKQRNQG